MPVDLSFTTKPADTAAYHALLEEVFVRELGYDVEVEDRYTPHSLIQVVRWRGEVVGGSRVVLPSPEGLPIETLLTLPAPFAGASCVEFSRMVFRRDRRKTLTPDDWAYVFRFTTAEVRRRTDARYVVFEAVQSLLPLYQAMGFTLHPAPVADPDVDADVCLMYLDLGAAPQTAAASGAAASGARGAGA